MPETLTRLLESLDLPDSLAEAGSDVAKAIAEEGTRTAFASLGNAALEGVAEEAVKAVEERRMIEVLMSGQQVKGLPSENGDGTRS
jgi:hypothetical protein